MDYNCQETAIVSLLFMKEVEGHLLKKNKRERKKSPTYTDMLHAYTHKHTLFFGWLVAWLVLLVQEGWNGRTCRLHQILHNSIII